jgi:hypothetical protein
MLKQASMEEVRHADVQKSLIHPHFFIISMVAATG